MPTIQLTQPIHAPEAAIWRSLSTSRGMSQWQADQVSGEVAVGQTLRLRWPTFGAEMSLKVEAIEHARRILLTDGASQLELGLSGNQVSLTHHVDLPEEYIAGMKSSWKLALSQLSYGLERHPGELRSCRWFTRSLNISAEQYFEWVTEPSLAGLWLWRGAVEPSREPLNFEFGGEALTGQMLCYTHGKDLSLSWHEQGHSTLTFRTLPAPFSATKRVVAIIWTRWAPEGEAFSDHPAPKAQRALGAPMSGKTEDAIDPGFELALSRLENRLKNLGES